MDFQPDVLKITKTPDSIRLDCVGTGSSYLRYTDENIHGTWKDVRVMSTPDLPEPEDGTPKVLEVQFTDAGAVIIGTDDVGIVQYGISGSTDPNTATWKASNVFANVKVGGIYYAFVKDTDGNISEPFRFTKPAQ